MTTLLIPSAKIVPQELQKIGKIPAVIYPLNQGIVLDYLRKLYDSYTDKTVIVLGENAEEAKRRLKKYQGESLELVCLERVRDLGYSIYEGLKSCPDGSRVVINFADTIVEDMVGWESGDRIYYAEEAVSDKWTYFEERGGRIRILSDKAENTKLSESSHKLFVGLFCVSDSGELVRCLERNLHKTTPVDSFYLALEEYSVSHPFALDETRQWFDIGHANSYFNSQLEVQAREFNYISIDRDRGILRKTSDDADKFIGEIKWYLKLPSDVEYVRPRIFDYSTRYEDPYVEMEYYSYHTVHELYLFGDLNSRQWQDIFKRIRFIYRDFSRYRLTGQELTGALEDMYLKKLELRFQKLKRDQRFKSFFEGAFVVNGKAYHSLNWIMERLRSVVPEKLYRAESFQIIHGDLCFSNIMIDENLNFIKLIDPRGSFGSCGIYGDARYELAKLFHSVDGKYDFIIKDLFHVDYDLEEGVIHFGIEDRGRGPKIYQCMVDCFQEEINGHLEEIELIEALLFLSMIPLHGESLDHQMAMLGTGAEILNRSVDIRL